MKVIFLLTQNFKITLSYVSVLTGCYTVIYHFCYPKLEMSSMFCTYVEQLFLSSLFSPNLKTTLHSVLLF